MNLATRCTACGTIFRVVQDQLRVSEGWVRCGRCAEVFDAGEQLFDLEHDTPPPWPPQAPGAQDAAQRPAPTPPAPQAQPPYHPYQGQFQPSQPGRLGPPTPTPPPYHPPAPSFEPAPPAPSYAPEPAFEPPPMRRAVDEFRPSAPMPMAPADSGWMPSDDESLNPFAPPRRRPEVEEPAEDWAASRPFAPPSREAPHSRFDETPEPHAPRREPFLDEEEEPDPRAHLPEPKGMRFEEDELPPPLPLPDDERPDVLLALSPATAAQLDAQEPSLDASAPISIADDDTRNPAAEEMAAKAEKKRRKKRKEPAAEAAPDSSSETVPSFMRQAEAAARWQRPGVRIALGAVALVLTLGLIGQGVWQGREAIAAQYPGVRPALVATAQAFGTELKPWRHIEALSVESSSLNPAGSGNHYRLSLSLRNRSNWEVAQPWVDLSLTDASGALVIRRMLSPTELQAGAAALAAGTDQQVQVVFDSGAAKISGYTVELFYP